jgi:formylglycine-generating enzyme required for sulfatase activity
MSKRTRPALVTVIVAAVAISAIAAQSDPASAPSEQSASQQAVSLQTLVDRAGMYEEQFTRDFANVVAEERYLQQVSGRQSTIGIRGNGVTAGTASPWQRRELLSDYLLVNLPDTNMWVPFRDVFEVDGKPVRERQDRIAKLLIRSTDDALEQAKNILKESARYNIGEVERTINMPLLALSFLDRAQQPRSRFSLGREDALVEGSWIVNFQERSRPTVIHSTDGRDLFSSGRMWIQPTGRVVKTEIVIQDRGLRAIIVTSFRADERFHLNVPFEMVEDYTLANRNHITGRATYGRFRRFDVTSTEAASTTPSTWITDPVTGMVLVEIPPGQFAMGNIDSEKASADEVVHDVTISSSFYLARFEVTQQEWKTVMGSAPSRFASCGARCPVENVNADDVQKFIERLNGRSTPDIHYRLPTEAEWEYACRAGTASAFSTGASITTKQANYGGKQPVPVGTFDANPWGLADMHGNVAEWTADWYAPYTDAAARDPHGPQGGGRRVTRGGSWEAPASAARCATRTPVDRATKSGSLGFRIAADMIKQ